MGKAPYVKAEPENVSVGGGEKAKQATMSSMRFLSPSLPRWALKAINPCGAQWHAE